MNEKWDQFPVCQIPFTAAGSSASLAPLSELGLYSVILHGRTELYKAESYLVVAVAGVWKTTLGCSIPANQIRSCEVQQHVRTMLF